MKKLDELLYLIDDCNIILEHQTMPDNCNGHYYGDKNLDMIIINKDIQSDVALYKTVLAEEVGHYFTCVGSHVSRKHMNYKERIELDRCEEKALKWALDFVVRTDELLLFISDNKRVSVEEIADKFLVTEGFLQDKFRYMAYEKVFWKLSDGRVLVLSELPGVYVVDMMVFE